MIEETISTAAAQRFYDRVGRRHDWAMHYEGKAKRRALTLLDVAPGQRVLDVGTGTGIDLVALSAAVQPEGVAVGVDLSPTMLGVTHKRTPSPLVRADCRYLPVATASIDRVFSAYLLDLIPTAGIAAAVTEFHRVLRPGGLLALASLTEGVSATSRTLMRLWTALYRRRPTALGGCRPVELSDAVEAAGFHIVACEVLVQLGVPSEVILARSRRF